MMLPNLREYACASCGSGLVLEADTGDFCQEWVGSVLVLTVFDPLLGG